MWISLENVISDHEKIFDLFNRVSSFIFNQLAKPFCQNKFTGLLIKI